MIRPIALCAILAAWTTTASAGPAQCWYYVHAKLGSATVDACVEKAALALSAERFTPRRHESRDTHISYLVGETARTTAQVMCYEVNGRRGKVMAFITVAGARACPVADNLFESMSEPETGL